MSEGSISRGMPHVAAASNAWKITALEQEHLRSANAWKKYSIETCLNKYVVKSEAFDSSDNTA